MDEFVLREIKKLVSEDELEPALDKLLIEDIPSKQLDQVVKLQGRLNKIKNGKLAGTISFEQENLERNRIREAILIHLERVNEPSKISSVGIRTKFPFLNKVFLQSGHLNNSILIIAGGILLIVIFILYSPSIYKNEEASFHLTIYVHGSKGDSDLLNLTNVRLRLGEYKIGPKKTDEFGVVIFDEIPGKFLKESISIEILDRPTKIISQSAKTAEESKKITFIVEPKGSWVKGNVFDIKTQVGLGGAILDFENGTLVDTTDRWGNYKIYLPFGEGEIIHLVIRHKGVEYYRGKYLVSDKSSRELPVNLN